jgi:SAM-dependent methyltransferase
MDLSRYADREFDVVFSNSVIEHLGTWENQQKMASEIRRVGKHYFVQTPNVYFPIEPHFLFPFFHFLPESYKIWIIRNFDTGWFDRIPDRKTAEAAVREIRLLSKKELKYLFPEVPFTVKEYWA